MHPENCLLDHPCCGIIPSVRCKGALMTILSPERTKPSQAWSPPHRRFVSRIAGTVIGSGFAGAVAGAIVFAGLWMATALPLGPSDRVIELFTSAPPLSIEALRGGSFIAALFGFFIGAVSGAIYELLRG